MKHAFALLGLLFLTVFVGAYIAFDRAHAPSGEEMLLDNTISNMSLSLTSPAFVDDETIPSRYTCDGENINPELHINGVPEGTQSFVLVMDDSDIPNEIKEERGISKFNHWVVYNIPSDTTIIPSNGRIGNEGLNSSGATAYTGACPPAQYEPTEHRYIFRLYALSGNLTFIKAPTLDEVEEAAKGIMLEKAELTGRYKRQ